MKNTIIELTNCEIDNVTGGMEWRVPWQYIKFSVALCMAYKYEDLATYQAIKTTNTNSSWRESIQNLGTGIFVDVFKLSFIFLGSETLVNTLIPFIAVKTIKIFN